ncbi:MAG: hypothetical protein Q9214_005194 [Letrouitia sp. 1 TL-2023]
MTAHAPSFPSSIDELTFPSASHNFSHVLSSLKRSHLSVANRLRSIDRDSQFVEHIANAYRLPVIANERCGSWYIPPRIKAGSAYFKSTDGHQGQWSFSMRRLNLQVLEIVGRDGGCVIADSTRRGKSMPDALLKTVPIWCAVFNNLLFGDEKEARPRLFTAEDVVSASEHSQIEERLDAFTQEAMTLQLNVPRLRSQLKKPLRPFWVTPDSSLPDIRSTAKHYHPVVCCTVSHRVHGAEGSENGYIQGAGDDSEGWSHGLTPLVFWKNRSELLNAPEEDLPDLISKLVKQEEIHSGLMVGNDAVLIKPTNSTYVGSLSAVSKNCRFDAVVICSEIASHKISTDTSTVLNKATPLLRLECPGGKLGSRALRRQLHLLSPFLSAQFNNHQNPRILFSCPKDNDLAIGTALVALCLFYGDDGQVDESRLTRGQETSGNMIDKQLIRQRLVWITTAKPSANLSRSTLQAVNSFLMQR